MKEYFKIDEIFRCRFMKFEVCPPKIIWDYIKQELNKSTSQKERITNRNKTIDTENFLIT